MAITSRSTKSKAPDLILTALRSADGKRYYAPFSFSEFSRLAHGEATAPKRKAIRPIIVPAVPESVKEIPSFRQSGGILGAIKKIFHRKAPASS